MPACVPIRDMKDTSKFAAMIEAANEPVVVTKNGRDAFVVMKPSDYEALTQAAMREKLLVRMSRAEEELARGEYADYETFSQGMRAAYGL